MKKNLDRRDFLKSCVLGTGSLIFRNPAKLFMASLFTQMLKQASASTVSTDNDFNFVSLLMVGGPTRFYFDGLLRPNGNADSLVANPAVGTTLDANLNLVYETCTDSRFNGLAMPKLWSGLIPRPGGGNNPMADLAPNMLALRFNIGEDSHAFNGKRQVRPTPGGLSLTGAVADVSSTPIPALTYSDTPDHLAKDWFGSNRGLSESAVYGTDPLSMALSPFSGAANLSEISNTQVNTAIDNLLTLMKTEATSRHPYVAAGVFDSRASAKNLMKRSFGNLQTVFNTLRDKYRVLINRSFTESALKLPFEKVNIPGSPTALRMNISESVRYSGSNLNGIFTSNTQIDLLAEACAITEFLLVNRLSSSVNFGFGYIYGLLFDQIIENYASSPTTKTNQTYPVIGLDSHYLGSVPGLITMTGFYRAVAACIFELISQLKLVSLPNGKNMFQQTVIQLTGDFGRAPFNTQEGYAHGYPASTTSLFSGMITACDVVGNICADTNSLTTGSYGLSSAVPANQNRPIQLGNQISTVATLLNVPSPTPNDASVVTKNTAGNAVLALPRGVTTS